MFVDYDDAVTSLLGRYVDEELAKTPVKDTKKRIGELKEEAKTIYELIIWHSKTQ